MRVSEATLGNVQSSLEADWGGGAARAVLTPSMSEELLAVLSLLPLAFTDLRARVRGVVTASD
eukprot:10547920-Lingulodinium_polyedra.AAC.1